MCGSGRLVVWLMMVLWMVQYAGAEVVPGAVVDHGKREVTFRFAPVAAAKSVHLAGSFNNWSQTAEPLQDKDGDGTWEVTLPLPAPAVHEYKFVVNGGQWVEDPQNPAQPAAGGGGFSNSMLELTLDGGAPPVPTAAPSVGAVGRLAEYPADADRASLRIEYKTADAEEVLLVWGLDEWMKPGPEWIPEGSESLDALTATPMKPVGAEVFELEMELPKGSVADFVFHITKPVERWDNNGGEGVDYHATMDRDNTVSVSWQGGDAPRRAGGIGARGWFIACFLLGIGLVLVDGVQAMKEGGRRSCVARAGIAIWIGLFAFVLRYDHAVTAGADLDEGDYVPIAMSYAHAIRNGDIGAMVNEPRVTEHPRWGFVQFGVAINLAGKDTANRFDEAMRAARIEAALLGGLTALLLALRFPIAGLCWSVFCIALHYTTMAYLDSTVAFFCVACVMSFDEALRRAGMREKALPDMAPTWRGYPVGWLLVSAVCAGLAMSSKYLAAVAPLSVTAGFVWWAWRARDKRMAGIFAAYVIVAVAAMFASDPHLWSGDWFERIVGRLRFHREFSTTGVGGQVTFPWYQPVKWLVTYQALAAHPVSQWLDILFTALGFGGLWLLLRRERFLFMTFVITLTFLIVWPTKWPQYETVLIPWIGVAADLLIREVGSRLLLLVRFRGAD